MINHHPKVGELKKHAGLAVVLPDRAGEADGCSAWSGPGVLAGDRQGEPGGGGPGQRQQLGGEPVQPAE